MFFDRGFKGEPQQFIQANAVSRLDSILTLEFTMMSFAILTAIAVFASGALEPIKAGDAKRCIRVLVHLACKNPGDVSFEASIENGLTLKSVRVLPPMDNDQTERVAACMMEHPLYFVPRFLGSKRIKEGVYVHTISPHPEACAE